MSEYNLSSFSKKLYVSDFPKDQVKLPKLAKKLQPPTGHDKPLRLAAFLFEFNFFQKPAQNRKQIKIRFFVKKKLQRKRKMSALKRSKIQTIINKVNCRSFGVRF